MGNDYVERERKSNIDINERRRLLRTKQSNEMNRLRQRQQQQIHQLVQKHRDQSAELERQISDEVHWIRCEIKESQNSNLSKSETVQIPLYLPFLNESHTVLVNGLVSVHFPLTLNFSSIIQDPRDNTLGY